MDESFENGPCCWQVLEIPETSDKQAIKAAYAAKMVALRQSRLDDDAQAVQRVRDAYQQAMSWRQPESGDTFGFGLGADSHSAAFNVIEIAAVWTQAESRPDMHETGQGQSREDDSPAESLEVRAKRAVEAVLQQGWQRDTGALLCRLCQQRRWQRPQARRVMHCVTAAAVELVWPEPTRGPDGELDILGAWPNWIRARLDLVLEFGGWMTTKQAFEWHAQDDEALAEFLARDVTVETMHEQEVPAFGMLWLLGQRDKLMSSAAHLLARRQPAPSGNSAADLLAEWLTHPCLQDPDSRLSLQQALARQLKVEPFTDSALLGEVIRQMDLQRSQGAPNGDASADVLLDAWNALEAPTLLRRIATGATQHPEVDRLTAAALQAKGVPWLTRRAAHFGLPMGGEANARRIRNSLKWLRANSPAALAAATPSVLAWWEAERVHASGMWFIPMALYAGIAAESATRTWPMPIQDTPIAIALALAAAAVGGSAGWALAAILANARMYWRRRLYPAWGSWDRKQTKKLPLLGQWIEAHGWRLSRDLIPLALLVTHHGPDSMRGYLSFVGWRLALAWLAKAP